MGGSESGWVGIGAALTAGTRGGRVRGCGRSAEPRGVSVDALGACGVHQSF